ncbi:S8 family serine peptidase [Hazenella sp. IB182357]|uniref:S8 family serine peptidase n=1 Tax=Polycladospora coralii TaxID=2771432 RepID=A0A926NIM2_9BACL|nr:S8 family serine peptidase [Polycladospora coralii]MBD1373953.1 S8 family serine peptidase [Polycladospora coralii]
MIKTTRFFSFLTAISLAASLFLPQAVQADAKRPTDKLNTNDEIIVKFEPNTSQSKRKSLLNAHSSELVSQNQQIGFDVVKVEGQSIEEAIADYNAMPNVEYAEKKVIYRASWSPNDPLYASNQQYGANLIQADDAWDINKGSKDVIVAVIDTGVQSDHPDLSGQLINGYDFISNDSNPYDEEGHGTHVAGTVAAKTNNGLGVAGIAPNVKIMPVRVLNEEGYGTNEEVANGIIYAADHGANIINLSLGDSEDSQVMQDAVNYAHNKGSLVIAAAGNDGKPNPHFPAYYSNVIAVGGVDRYDNPYNNTNYGSWVDVAAPGVQVMSTTLGGGYGRLTGTSMATPHVAGVAALLASQGLSRDQIRQAIEETAEPVSGTGRLWTHGRVNAFKALGGSTADTGDTYEPNNRKEQAYGPLQSSKTYQSQISNASDIDWFKFETKASGEIKLNLSSLPADYDLYLLDSSGKQLASSRKGSKSDESITFTTTSPGNYFVKVEGYNGAYNTSQSYTLQANYPASSQAESTWFYEPLTFETSHPYTNNYNKSHTYTKEGVSKVALHFSRLETEANYDFVHIKDKDGKVVKSYDGNLDAFWIIVDGDTAISNLVSDHSVNGYGYKIDQVAYHATSSLSDMSTTDFSIPIQQ